MRYAEAGYELRQKFRARREIKTSRRSADGATLPYQHRGRRHAPAARVRPVIAPPVWICPTCEKPMRVRSIEVANGEEHIKLACAPCGTEATQSTKLPD
jgi:hypothetical protein